MPADENERAARSAAMLADWARLLLGSLARAGVQHVVISPGSRSTPFAWAALETEELTCHSAIDERAAAFFALGQARVTAKPTLLVCTSGSAAAQYYPAVVEASMSAIPLIALTADRPFELQAAGASQCLDQTKLYGDFVRLFLELGHPDDSPSALDGLVRMAAQAVAAAVGPAAGPVHLNAKARKPLEPPMNAGGGMSEAVRSRLARGPTRIVVPPARIDAADVSELAALCETARRGLIVCGPIATTEREASSALIELARASGYPIAVEATSQVRFQTAPSGPEPVVVGGLEALSAVGFLARMAPELVIVLGSTPASAELERFLTRTETPYAVVSPHGHHDPIGKARWLLRGSPIAAARALSELLSSRIGAQALDPRRATAAEWARADEAYFTLVEQRLAGSDGPLTEPLAVRTAVEALPRGGVLGLGNSLPVRNVDAFVRPRALGVSVWSQRGASGIDGLVSGAIGAASVAQAPCVTLVGDVTFLHDVSGLALAKEATSPLALVVVDNGGGRIFETLPVVRLFSDRPELARFWTTPQGYDIAHAAALYDVPYHRAEDLESLRGGLAKALGRPGCSVIHALVAPDSCRALSAELRQALAARLSR